LADYLHQEIEQLGFTVQRVERTAVWLHGDLRDAMKLNYMLRTANRVLFLIDEFMASTPDQLYRELLRIRWEDYIPAYGYVSIHGYVRNEHINDPRFAFMRVKDAVVDRINDKKGRRPDSGPDMSRAALYIHWANDLAALYLDTSGETIAKHGYRKMPFKAPMMESLAAAVIMATGWSKDEVFINPMCGSGTLAIEAALMAKAEWPGKFRDNFSFMHFLKFDKNAWEEIRNIQPATGRMPQIIASDHDMEALQAARTNARMAGVADMIRFELCDFSETSIPEGKGIIIMNPEYGERLGVTNQLQNVYKSMGDFLKQKGEGKTGYIFTGNPDLAKKIGLRSSRKLPFLNGRIECRLLEFELYSGSRRDT
jgi:putative N6-adenine-specific DNA methylase